MLLDTVAHELRNPLSSLCLSLDMLVHDYDCLEPEAALRLVKRAQRSAIWLQTLTDNLTSAACVAAGQLDVHLAPVDVRTCIEDALLLVHGLLEQRNQSVAFTSAGPAPLVLADAARVTQIVSNLLTNASRYSVEGDAIEVSVAVVGPHLRIRVTDHGPGISARDQDRIFGAWIRAEGVAAGGLGLGLSIVQSLVQQHGGRVGVQSALGEGATFWFTLPIANSTGLTPREWEVARLLARGASNRQIARDLTVSDRTVDTHVSHILRKLGLSSRTQIAAWVFEQRSAA
jgi:signal transduction histidine kinase